MDLLAQNFKELNREIISGAHVDDLLVGTVPLERAVFHYKLHTHGELAAITYWTDFKDNKAESEVAAQISRGEPYHG